MSNARDIPLSTLRKTNLSSIYPSDYTRLSTTLALSSEIVEGLSNQINPQLSTIAGLVEVETARLDELSTSLATVAKTGSYNDLSDKPNIPTKVSQLQNDSGFVTSSEVDTKISEATANLTTYVDLSSAQTIVGEKTLSGVDLTIVNSESTHSADFSFDSITTENGIYVFPTLSGSSVLATEEVRSVLPILSSNEASIQLTKDKYVYRVVDENASGAFPTLTAPTDVQQSGPYYFMFEIEWTTSAALASYTQTFDWINYPEMVSGGSAHTYYIAGRWDSAAGTYTMNCWRVK